MTLLLQAPSYFYFSQEHSLFFIPLNSTLYSLIPKITLFNFFIYIEIVLFYFMNS